MSYQLGDIATDANGQIHHIIATNGAGLIVSVTDPGRYCEIHVGVVPVPKDGRCRFTEVEIEQLRNWTADRMSVAEQAARLGRTVGSILEVRHRHRMSWKHGLRCVECDGRHYGRNLCIKHYRRWQRRQAHGVGRQARG